MSNLSIFQRQGIYQIIAVYTHTYLNENNNGAKEKTAKSSVVVTWGHEIAITIRTGQLIGPESG